MAVSMRPAERSCGDWTFEVQFQCVSQIVERFFFGSTLAR
jgi:hypothetical protein